MWFYYKKHTVLQAIIYLGPHRVARRLGSLREPMRAAQELALLSQMRFFLSLVLTFLFEEIWPGLAACLRLRGAKGGLDIWSIYCPTGAEVTDNDLFGFLPLVVRSCQTFVGLRDHLRLRVARAMAPALEVLSCVGGDWNYVSESGDRRTLTTMDEAGERDRNEELHFVNRLGKPFGLMELKQEAMTHQSGRSHSRLDRIYMNFHRVDQLDKHIQSIAMPWCSDLSSHRPVSVRRTTATRSAQHGVSKAALQHADFGRRVQLAYEEILFETP